MDKILDADLDKRGTIPNESTAFYNIMLYYLSVIKMNFLKYYFLV